MAVSVWYYFFYQYSQVYYKAPCANLDKICNEEKSKERTQAISMWMLSNVANFTSQMALIVILYSFGKKSEKKKDTPPESPSTDKETSDVTETIEKSETHNNS